ncbi:MAG TPA: zinc ribbon domain-containing protein [Kofleriaceae bacterium]|jgi:hypothetical protein
MSGEPSRQRREELRAMLADFVARGGAGPLLAPPVIPGAAAFPEPWRATRAGVHTLLRRLAWHAGNERAVRVLDERVGAPPTERKPETRVGLQLVEKDALTFRIEFIGTDDVAGTLAHELGVAHAAVNRADAADPYRAAEQKQIEIDADRDLERGSIATVYLGLGVLAANAAYQQYTRPGRFNGAYEPHEYDQLTAGHVPMADLAYLLAAQAVVRGADIPPGLLPPQRDEVRAWMAKLDARGLSEQLGISQHEIDAAREKVDARVKPDAFTDLDLEEDAPPRRNAFRWRTHRGGVGLIAGAVLGLGISAAVAAPEATVWIVLGAASSGHVAGRRVRVPRCSGCASVVDPDSTTCPHCRAALRGDIASLAERLEAEERLEHRPGSDS